jgi:hypothetical protein
MKETGGPYHVDDETWYYIGSNAITIVHKIVIRGRHLNTIQVDVPYDKLSHLLDNKQQ